MPGQNRPLGRRTPARFQQPLDVQVASSADHIFEVIGLPGRPMPPSRPLSRRLGASSQVILSSADNSVSSYADHLLEAKAFEYYRPTRVLTPPAGYEARRLGRGGFRKWHPNTLFFVDAVGKIESYAGHFIESSGGVSSAASHETEWLAGLIKQAPHLTEWLAALSVAVDHETEWLSTTTQTAGQITEWLLTIATTADDPIESKGYTGVSANADSITENLFSISATADSLSERLSSVEKDLSAPTENLLGLYSVADNLEGNLSSVSSSATSFFETMPSPENFIAAFADNLSENRGFIVAVATCILEDVLGAGVVPVKREVTITCRVTTAATVDARVTRDVYIEARS